jgi:hypothetical protein
MAKTAPAPAPAPAKPGVVSIPAPIAAPDLHGDPNAVAEAASRLFGLGLEADSDATAVDVADETVESDAEVEQKTESDAQEAKKPPEASKTSSGETEAPDLDKLRQVALERAQAREAKQAEATLEARLKQVETESASNRQAAEAFRRMQAMGKEDPIALIEALGIDPVPFLQSGHRQAINREGHTMAQKLDQALARIAELEGHVEQVPQHLEAQKRAQVNERARREFVAITEAADKFPFLAIEPAESRLGLAQEMANILIEAGEDVTHERVAGLAESKLRRDYERKAAALGHKLDTSSPATSEGGSARRQSPKTITNQLSAELPASREPTPAERDRAAAAIAARMFGLSS